MAIMSVSGILENTEIFLDIDSVSGFTYSNITPSTSSARSTWRNGRLTIIGKVDFGNAQEIVHLAEWANMIWKPNVDYYRELSIAEVRAGCVVRSYLFTRAYVITYNETFSSQTGVGLFTLHVGQKPDKLDEITVITQNTSQISNALINYPTDEESLERLTRENELKDWAIKFLGDKLSIKSFSDKAKEYPWVHIDPNDINARKPIKDIYGKDYKDLDKIAARGDINEIVPVFGQIVMRNNLLTGISSSMSDFGLKDPIAFIEQMCLRAQQRGENIFDLTPEQILYCYAYASKASGVGAVVGNGILAAGSLGIAIWNKASGSSANAQAATKSASSKIIKNADDVTFRQSSVDKAFAKHSSDFGNYADGSKASVDQFTNDLKGFIETGIQKGGTYRTTQGTHIYNPTTQQWVFINSDNTFNTGFKLSSDQFKYLIETGVVK